MPENRAVDMSPKAIERRLRDVSELFQLGMALRRARFLGKTVELRRAEGAKKGVAPESATGQQSREDAER